MMSVTKDGYTLLKWPGLNIFKQRLYMRLAKRERERASRHSTRIDYHVTLVAKFRGHMIHIQVNKMADSAYKFVV